MSKVINDYHRLDYISAGIMTPNASSMKQRRYSLYIYRLSKTPNETAPNGKLRKTRENMDTKLYKPIWQIWKFSEDGKK